MGALYMLTVAVLNVAALLFFRSGLHAPWKLLTLCACLIVMAAGVHALLIDRPLPGGLPPRVTACLGALLVLLSPLAAHVSGPILFYAYPAGAALAMAFLLAGRPGIRASEAGAILGIAVLSFAYLFLATNNQGIANLYAPEQMVLGLLNRDTTFHTAVAHLIMTEGHPSLGMDGALPLTYHVMSHYWFAALAMMGGSEPIFAYMAGVGIVLVPMLLFSLIAAAGACSAKPLPFTFAAAFALALLFVSDWIGWSLLIGTSRMDPHSWSSYYISESYTLALIALLLALPVFYSRCGNPDVPQASSGMRLALALCAIPVLTALKISVGVLWAVAWIYAAIRREGFKVRGLAEAGAVALVALIALAWLAPGTSEYLPRNEGIVVPFYFLRLYPEIASLSSLVIPLAFVGLAMRRASAAGERLRDAMRGGRFLYVEAVAIVTAVGLAPALLGIPQDSAVWYFLNVAQWFALPALIAEHEVPALRISLRAIAESDLRLGLAIVGAFLLLMRLDMVSRPSFLQLGGAVVRTIDERASGQFLKGRTVSGYARGSVAREHRLFGGAFAELLERTPGASIKQMVAKAREGKGRLAVFVPPTNLEFWTLTPTCYSRFHLFPAITGVPMLLGAPPRELGCADQPYTRNYGPTPYSREIDDEGLCKHARPRNIDRIYVLQSARDPAANRELHCSPS